MKYKTSAVRAHKERNEFMKIKVRLLCSVFLLLLLFTACTTKVDTSSPKGITEAFLASMQKGDYQKACTYAGIEFDEKTYEKSAALQKELMKETYANMEFEIGDETVKEDKAIVAVTVRNSNYIELLNDAIYQTMKESEDDAYTKKKYRAAMKKADKKELEVLVNYRREKEKWVFDGSNSQLYAAMLGYLQ